MNGWNFPGISDDFPFHLAKFFLVNLECEFQEWNIPNFSGWWFGTAVGSTPTSRCGRALPIVERFVHRFVPWISSWILQLSTLEVGSPMWSRLMSLVLCMSAIWSDQFSLVPFWCLVASLMVLLMCSPFWMLSWCSFSLFRRWRWMMLLGSCITYSMHGRTSSNWSMLAAG